MNAGESETVSVSMGVLRGLYGCAPPSLTCMCTYMPKHVCILMHAHLRIVSQYMCIYTSACVWARECVCKSVHEGVCIGVCFCINDCVSLCACLGTHMYECVVYECACVHRSEHLHA